jgi:hypothetical protein
MTNKIRCLYEETTNYLQPVSLAMVQMGQNMQETDYKQLGVSP